MIGSVSSLFNSLLSATRLKVATVILICFLIAFVIAYIIGCDPISNFMCFIKTYEEANEIDSMFKAVNLDEVHTGHTKFSHISDAKFEQLLLPALELDCSGSSYRPEISSYIPDEFDWRDFHMVGPVIDQKQCNGCWAISIVGVMETMLAKKNPPNRTHRHMTTLSIQELIDCSLYNKGCRRGDVKAALSYMRDNHMKIVTEKEYPLMLVDQDCKLGKNPQGVGIENYTSICFPSSDLICSVVANHGPVVTLVNAKNWKNYNGGIINGGCSGREEYLTHVVQIVGYNRIHSVPYYTVRNSWGDTGFGHGGYVYISMGHNMCGIESNIFYLDVN